MPKVIVSTKEVYYLLNVDDMPSLQNNSIEVSDEYYEQYSKANKAYLMLEDELGILYKEQYKSKGIL